MLMVEVFLPDSQKNIKKIFLFEKSVFINCRIDELYNFHLDTNNLPKISPSFPKASIKKISEIPLREGSSLTVTLNFFLFKTDWEILIKKVEQNKFIGDLQVKGIFEYWYHSHIFESKGDGVIMTDKVEFIPPFGFIGKIFLPVIKIQLYTMFNYRHKKTKLIFEK
jgi:ligand-binding SRPBCC domain-containing protein